MRWYDMFPSLLTALPFLSIVNAVFLDDAYHIDYHEALLGTPLPHTTFFSSLQSSSNASLLYSVSDKAVLGAINPRDGSLVWRQRLAGDLVQKDVETYLVPGLDGHVFSGYESTVAAWGGQDGRLTWDHILPEGQRVRGLQGIMVLEALHDRPIAQDVVVLSGPAKDSSGAVVARVGDQGTKWTYNDASIGPDASISVATSSTHAYYMSRSTGLLAGSKTKVVVLDIHTGAEISQHSIALDSEPLGDAGSYSTGSCSEAPILVSSEKPYKSLKVNVLGHTKIVALNLEIKADDIQQLSVQTGCGDNALSHFLVHARSSTRDWAEVFHVDTKTGATTKAYSLPALPGKSAFTATSVAGTTYFARITESEVLLYSSVAPTELGRWSRASAQGEQIFAPSHAAVEVSTRGKNGLALRAAVVTSIGEWSLLRNGETQWIRPEMLAYIDKAVWAEEIIDQSASEDIKAEAVSNPVTAYVLRLTRHAQELAYLPQYLLSLPEKWFGAVDDRTSIRQLLIGGKYVLAGTSRQEIFALDAAQGGAVRWRLDLSDKLTAASSIIHMSVVDSRLTAYASDGSMVVVHIKNGEVLEVTKASDSFDQIIELPGTPASAIVKVSADGVPEVFSDLAPAAPSEGNAVLTINAAGEAVGWTIGSSIQKTWTVKPPSGLRFVHAASRPVHDPIASIGRVLGDRSVLYKYLTPNLALLTALSSTTLSIYLVNAVTGTVLHTASHEGVLSDFPCSTVISENWFAYTFTNRDPATSGLATQLVVSELFESEYANDRGPLLAQTNYSSFSPDANGKPHVLSQTYQLAAPISDLAVTQTNQGITTRQVLAYIPSFNSIIGLPRDAINPRRPVGRDPTAHEAEEGLFRYMPELPLDPKMLLSHNRQVIGIKKLMATPTLIESTSMVFAFGHDIFGTQVAPSTAFDVLGKGFNRFQLILTIVALYAGVLFIRPLVRKRMVNSRFNF